MELYGVDIVISSYNYDAGYVSQLLETFLGIFKMEASRILSYGDSNLQVTIVSNNWKISFPENFQQGSLDWNGEMRRYFSDMSIIQKFKSFPSDIFN